MAKKQLIQAFIVTFTVLIQENRLNFMQRFNTISLKSKGLTWTKYNPNVKDSTGESVVNLILNSPDKTGDKQQMACLKSKVKTKT